MTLIAMPARPGVFLDCDTIGTLTPARLAAAMAYVDPSRGPVVGLAGYCPLPGEKPDGTLWTVEALDLVTSLGLQALWIQHPLAAGWLPSEHLGALHEATASEYALSVGFPADMHGEVDVEGCGGPSYGYALTWASNRVQRGGKCSLYYGWKLGMSLEQCAALPNVTSYHRAFNQPILPGRGPALIQGPTVDIPGFGAADVNLMIADVRGELPLVCGAG